MSSRADILTDLWSWAFPATSLDTRSQVLVVSVKIIIINSQVIVLRPNVNLQVPGCFLQDFINQRTVSRLSLWFNNWIPAVGVYSLRRFIGWRLQATLSSMKYSSSSETTPQ
ncbi:hypothetical protein F2P79_018655 [Pimephales promelas]|nr:hypothetical protein F2P79_018655 [Pimephales promelas]